MSAPTEAETSEAKRLHKAWQNAASELEESELVALHAVDRLEYAKKEEAAATKAYLDFHDAYWAKRGEGT